MINPVALQKPHTPSDGECVRVNRATPIRSYSLTRCSRWVGIGRGCAVCLGAKLNITFATNRQAFHTEPAAGCWHWWCPGRPASPLSVVQNAGASTASHVVGMPTRLHFSASRQCRPHMRDFQGHPSVLRIRGGRRIVWMKDRHRCLQGHLPKESRPENKGASDYAHHSSNHTLFCLLILCLFFAFPDGSSSFTGIWSHKCCW